MCNIWSEIPTSEKGRALFTPSIIFCGKLLFIERNKVSGCNRYVVYYLTIRTVQNLSLLCHFQHYRFNMDNVITLTSSATISCGIHGKNLTKHEYESRGSNINIVYVTGSHRLVVNFRRCFRFSYVLSLDAFRRERSTCDRPCWIWHAAT